MSEQQKPGFLARIKKWWSELPTSSEQTPGELEVLQAKMAELQARDLAEHLERVKAQNAARAAARAKMTPEERDLEEMNHQSDLDHADAVIREAREKVREMDKARDEYKKKFGLD